VYSNWKEGLIAARLCLPKKKSPPAKRGGGGKTQDDSRKFGHIIFPKDTSKGLFLEGTEGRRNLRAAARKGQKGAER